MCTTVEWCQEFFFSRGITAHTIRADASKSVFSFFDTWWNSYIIHFFTYSYYDESSEHHKKPHSNTRGLFALSDDAFWRVKNARIPSLQTMRILLAAAMTSDRLILTRSRIITRQQPNGNFMSKKIILPINSGWKLWMEIGTNNHGGFLKAKMESFCS